MPENQVAEDTSIFNGKIEDLPPMDVLTDQAFTGLDGFFAESDYAQPMSQLEHDARLAADSLLQRLPLDMELAGEP